MIDYIMVEKALPSGEIQSAIKITEGMFKDTIFNFREIKFADEPEEDGNYRVFFSYDVYYSPIEELDENKILIENDLACILGDMLTRVSMDLAEGEESAREGNNISCYIE